MSVVKLMLPFGSPQEVGLGLAVAVGVAPADTFAVAVAVQPGSPAFEMVTVYVPDAIPVKF